MSSDGKIQTAVENGGQIYVSYADSFIHGKVGIGTTSPSTELEVNGSVNVTGTQHFGNGQIYWDGSNSRMVIKVT